MLFVLKLVHLILVTALNNFKNGKRMGENLLLQLKCKCYIYQMACNPLMRSSFQAAFKYHIQQWEFLEAS